MDDEVCYINEIEPNNEKCLILPSNKTTLSINGKITTNFTKLIIPNSFKVIDDEVFDALINDEGFYALINNNKLKICLQHDLNQIKDNNLIFPTTLYLHVYHSSNTQLLDLNSFYFDRLYFNKCKTNEDVYNVINAYKYFKILGYKCLCNKQFNDFVLPQQIESVCSNAFENCDKLQNFSLANDSQLKRIEDHAFKGCTSLSNVDLSNALQCQLLGNDTFDKGYPTNEFKFPVIKQIETILSGANVKTIVIPIGVTEICYGAFANCESLSDITLPERLIKIRNSAFVNCKSLTKIEIPESVEQIDSNVFENCESLTDFKLNQEFKLKKFGEYVFSGCKSLQSLNLYTEGECSLTSLPDNMFGDMCYLNEISLPSELTKIGNNVFKSSNFKIDNAYHEDEITFVLRGSVNEIGAFSFSCNTELTNVDLSATGLEIIPISAFANCESLVSVKLPEGLTEICNNAFVNCRSLTEIEIPKSVKKIGSNVFENPDSLTKTKTPKLIPSNVFANCESLVSVKLPEGLTEIGNNAFVNCRSLNTITTYDEFINISSKTDLSNHINKEIDTNKKIIELEKSCKASISKYENVLPSSLTIIGDGAFENTGLKTINLMLTDIKELSKRVFANCEKLISVYVNATCTTVDERAFLNSNAKIMSDDYKFDYNNLCNSLKENNKFKQTEQFKKTALDLSFKTINTAAFFGYKPTTIDLQHWTQLQTINESAFCQSNIKTVYIPYKFTSLQSIGKNAFNNASKVDGLSSFSYYNDGRTNNNIKIEYQTIIIPENLTEIGESAFNNCREAHVIYDGTSEIHCLTSIGNKAFFNNFALVDVDLQYSKLEKIPESCFEGCALLTKILLPTTIKQIETNAFKLCKLLQSIKVEKCTYFGNSAFEDCEQLVIDIKKDAKITYIGYGAFKNTRLCNLDLTNSSITDIQSKTFHGCSDLTNVVLPQGIKSINEEAFCVCGIKNIQIPDGVTSLGNNVFSSCTNLTNVELPKSLTQIGCNAFKYTKIKELDLSNLTLLNDSICQNCEELTKIVLNKELSSIGDNAFDYCVSLTNINLPNKLKSIGNNAFSNSGLSNIVLPQNLKSIGKSVFSNSKSLETIDASQTLLTDIPESTFENCTNLINIDLPNGLQYIDKFAFENTGIEQITIPPTLQNIDKLAFSDDLDKQPKFQCTTDVADRMNTLFDHKLRENHKLDVKEPDKLEIKPRVVKEEPNKILIGMFISCD